MEKDKVQEEIIDEFSIFDDWLDKYDYLISLSDQLPAIAPEHRTEQYVIQGCQQYLFGCHVAVHSCFCSFSLASKASA